jgi:hypothetical protein
MDVVRPPRAAAVVCVVAGTGIVCIRAPTLRDVGYFGIAAAGLEPATFGV